MVQLATWTNNVLKRSGSPLPSSSSSASDRLPDYHHSNTGDDSAMKNPLSKLAPQERKWAIGILAAIIVIVFFLLPGSSSSNDPLSAAHLRLDKFPETFRFAVIADLDQRSKLDDGKLWKSIYMTATLKRKGDSYDIKWDTPNDVVTSHNEAGRGCELSELVRYNDQLYTFDDRTGIMFEIHNPENSGGLPSPYLVPRHIFMEGKGDINDKGLKIEWATVKDNLMYVGSFGKEYTNNKGEVVHTNNLWVVTYNREGIATHHDWKGNYDRMRSALGYDYPGYLLHETVVWSPHARKWFVLPRRVSNEAYNEEADEKRGSNIIIMASHDFSDITWITVGTKTPERGYSSAKFLPGSRDSVLITLKSEENSKEQTQKTYVSIIGEVPMGSGVWKVLMEETELPINAKFEGLEILAAG